MKITSQNMNKHYLIVGDGEFVSRELLLKVAQNRTIIALDGAAKKLKALNIFPHILLGDFDTLHASDLEFWRSASVDDHSIQIVPRKNQNKTDLIKAIEYCDQQQARSIYLICVTGNRLDHHEMAMRSLRSHYKKDRPLILFTALQILQFAKEETVIISGKIGDSCAVLAYPKATITSSGLQYEMDHFPLEFAFSESVANVLKDTQAKIIVQGEALIMAPLMFPPG